MEEEEYQNQMDDDREANSQNDDFGSFSEPEESLEEVSFGEPSSDPYYEYFKSKDENEENTSDENKENASDEKDTSNEEKSSSESKEANVENTNDQLNVNGFNQNNHNPFNGASDDERENIANRINSTKEDNMVRNSPNNPEGRDNKSKSNEDGESNTKDDKAKTEESKTEEKAEGEPTEGTKGNPVNDLKNRVANNVVNSAANSDNELASTIGKGIQTAQEIKKTADKVKAASSFLKVLITPPIVYVVIGILAIILIVLFMAIIPKLILNSLGLDFNSSEDEIYETIKDAELTDIVSTSKSQLSDCESTGFDNFRRIFTGLDLSNSGDYCQYIKNQQVEYNKKVKGSPFRDENTSAGFIEENPAIKYAPGLTMSTVYYAFDSQALNDDGSYTISIEVDGTNEVNELDAASALFAAKVFDTNDMQTIMKNQIKSSFDYYKYENGKCTKKTYGETFSSKKLQVFLRYGEAEAINYENDYNTNKAIELTDKECTNNLSTTNKLSLTKYDNPIDYTTNTISGGLTSVKSKYERGFVYSKFPRFMAKYNKGTKPAIAEDTIFIIEDIVSSVASREPYINCILGYGCADGSNGIATGEWASWKQYDSNWGSKALGTSGETLASAGCFLTSISMSIAKSANNIVIDDFNPGTLLDAATSAGIITASGESNSSQLIKVATGSDNFESISHELTGTFESKVAEIESYLSQGYDVVIRVKSDESNRILRGSGIWHYVFVTGVQNGTIYIADPGYNVNTVLYEGKYINEGLVQAVYLKYN